jgi:hypothetical protein
MISKRKAYIAADKAVNAYIPRAIKNWRENGVISEPSDTKNAGKGWYYLYPDTLPRELAAAYILRRRGYKLQEIGSMRAEQSPEYMAVYNGIEIPTEQPKQPKTYLKRTFESLEDLRQHLTNEPDKVSTQGLWSKQDKRKEYRIRDGIIEIWQHTWGDNYSTNQRYKLDDFKQGNMRELCSSHSYLANNILHLQRAEPRLGFRTHNQLWNEIYADELEALKEQYLKLMGKDAYLEATKYVLD